MAKKPKQGRPRRRVPPSVAATEAVTPERVGCETMARRCADALVSEIVGEPVPGGAGARLCYGEPVRVGGRTVIPVARVGAGAPARVGARPVGFIEVNAEGSRYLPIGDPRARAAARGRRRRGRRAAGGAAAGSAAAAGAGARVPGAALRTCCRPSARVQLIAFVVGAASLGAEIAAARLLAPYFGDSTLIWAEHDRHRARRAVGRLLDRRALRPTATRRCAGCAGSCSSRPCCWPSCRSWRGPFLAPRSTRWTPSRPGAFVGSLHRRARARRRRRCCVLGMVSPYAVRLSVHAVDEAGRVAGRLYAISTLGSLAGTFLSALLLIPLVGTRRTFLAVRARARARRRCSGCARRWPLAPRWRSRARCAAGRGRSRRPSDAPRARRGARPSTVRARDRAARRGAAGSSSTRGRRSTRCCRPTLVSDRRLLGRAARAAVRRPAGRRPAAARSRSSATRAGRPRAPTATTSRPRASTRWRSTAS